MSNTLRSVTLAASLLAGFAVWGMSPAEAKTMAECSALYKADKAAGGTMKWNDFRKAKCAADSADATPAEEPATTTKSKKKPAATTAATTDGQTFAQKCSASWAAMKDANQVPDGMTWNDFRKAKCVVPASAKAASTKATGGDAGGQTFAQKCSASWAAMKDANQVPEGMTWNDFRKAKCIVPASVKSASTKASGGDSGGQTFSQKCSANWAALKEANQVPDGLTWNDFRKAKCVVDASILPQAVDENATPVEPTEAVNLDNIDVATVSKSGKPFTPGQIAAHKRQKACGVQWRQDKQAGALKVGMKWPQYWSQCNTKMKAALTN